jgi:flagellar protein FliJ
MRVRSIAAWQASPETTGYGRQAKVGMVLDSWSGVGSNWSGVSNMRSREAALRSKRFEIQEKARKVQGLEQMIHEFEQIAIDLARQVSAEEDRTGVRDRTHFAYSTYAKAANLRRDKLLASIEDLRVKLNDAVRERDEAEAGMAAIPHIEVAELSRDRRRPDRQVAASIR